MPLISTTRINFFLNKLPKIPQGYSMKMASRICLALLVASCYGKSEVDLNHEREKLLALHALDRQAHFNLDAESLSVNTIDTFIYVGDGKINYIRKADQINGFKEYFKDATYSKWDNLEEPIIQISEDGTVAWMITRVEVARAHVDSLGNQKSINFIYAGIMTYKKENGEWAKQANVSTFEPITIR